MSDSDRNDERGGRFRRPQFDAPGPEDGEAGLPSIRPEQAAREMARYMEPLKHLAQAFQQNTEALKSMAEGQAKMGRRIERSDRSEAVIQSTQALNETFRGVQRTQERLIGKMDEERKRPWLLTFATIAFMALLIGGLVWYLLSWLDEREAGQVNPGIAMMQSGLDKQAATIDDLRSDLEGRDQRIDGLQRTIRDNAEELGRQEGLVREQEAIAEGLRKAISDLEEENRGFQETQASASRLLTDNVGLRADADVMRQQVEKLRTDLAAARSTLSERDAKVLDLTRRLEAMVRREVGGGRPPPVEVPARPEPVAGVPEERADAVPVGIPAGAMTDVGQLDRLRSVLNKLVGGDGGSTSCEFLKMGGVRGRVLYDVRLVTRDAEGRESSVVEGNECRIVYMESERRAEIRFWHGFLTYYGVRTKFLGNRHVVRIPEISPLEWQRSGLTILERIR